MLYVIDGEKEAEGTINKTTNHFICGKKSRFNYATATEAMKMLA